jgi:regulator of protease activity HflC (stomatin/prohibitin superfamily)
MQMMFLIGGLVAAAVLAIVLAVRISSKKSGKKVLWLLSIPVVFGLVFSMVTYVPTGYTGILVTFGKVSPNTLESGAAWKSPFQQLVLMDNRVQKVSGVAAAFSKDIQQVDVTYSVNYEIDQSTAFNLYKTVGTTYFDTVVTPRLLENIKGVTSKYTAENLVENRTELSVKITEILMQEMLEYGINIKIVNIENIDFTDAFTDAVEAKQVAEQTLIKTRTEQEQEIVIANAEAEKKIIAAQAEADSIRIAAEAEAERIRIEAEAQAEANRVLAESLSDAVLRYQTIMQWDGVLPRFMSDDGTPLIELGE